MTTEITSMTEDGMDSLIATDDIIEKWKTLFDMQFSIYKDFSEKNMHLYDIFQIQLILGMLEDLNARTTGKSHTG